MRSLVSAALAGLILIAAPSTAASASPAYTPGAPGVGDPYLPEEGNGGYDVKHYDLDIKYGPATDRLDGRATVTAQATQNLSRFDLDLQGLTVSEVTVNGARATFTRSDQELVVTPRRGLPKWAPFVVSVRYGGVPQPLGGPIVFGSPYGWIATDDGACVACEPNAASTWYPSNDHPSDKATFTFLVTVPTGLYAVANGDLVAKVPWGPKTMYIWNENKPMATYLATTTIGRFDVQRGTTPAGIPELVASDPSVPPGDPSSPDLFALSGEATDYWSSLFGTYPFSSTGAILDNAPVAGFSLETQTRPIYSALRSETTVVHELSHQWFGDSLSVASWNNTWLNEGFATYAQWLWDEHKGRRSAHDRFLQEYNARPATSTFWQVKPGDPGRDTMFAGAVYQRGGMTLQVLRDTIGDQAFFSLLRQWVAAHKYGNVKTSEFVALAEKVSHRDLSGLFDTWLFTTGKPALPAS